MELINIFVVSVLVNLVECRQIVVVPRWQNTADTAVGMKHCERPCLQQLVEARIQVHVTIALRLHTAYTSQQASCLQQLVEQRALAHVRQPHDGEFEGAAGAATLVQRHCILVRIPACGSFGKTISFSKARRLC